MRFKPLIPGLLVSAAPVLAQVVTYEANSSYPEEEGWTRITSCTPERDLAGGRLLQTLEIGGCGIPPAGGDWDVYTRSIAEFAGADFFTEFRMRTDGPSSEFVFRGPSTVDLGSGHPAKYHFTIGTDQVMLEGPFDLPLVFIDFDEDTDHTFRLELRAAQSFRFFVDDETVFEGLPEGPYPTSSAFMNFDSLVKTSGVFGVPARRVLVVLG